MTLMDVGEIARMLGDRVDSLVPALLPGAVREGLEWRVGSVAGERGRSMAIHRGGGRRGVWKDFSSDHLGGDALELVAHVKFGGDKRSAIAWARSWLGLDNLDPARLKEVRAQVQQKKTAEDEEALKKAQRMQSIAKGIWHGASKVLVGSVVDRYLVGRGIRIADLPRPPGAIRYVSSLEYPPRMNDGILSSWPAMVAMIQRDGQHVATHRTYLQVKPGGIVVKAPVVDAKLTLGSVRGGFISLARGASGKPIAQAPEGDEVILCEGIEDGFSIALAQPEARVLAAINVGNFQCLQLPAQIKKVTIAADNDDPDSQAGRSLQAAIDAFIDQGREVLVARSPIGKDFNDALQAGLSADAYSEAQ